MERPLWVADSVESRPPTTAPTPHPELRTHSDSSHAAARFARSSRYSAISRAVLSRKDQSWTSFVSKEPASHASRIVSASRSILYPKRDTTDSGSWETAVERAAESMREELNAIARQ